MKHTSDHYHILHLSETVSTNTVAMETTHFRHLDAVLADRQTGGKGRHGRAFFSPDGGLYLSVILEPHMLTCTLPFCTVAAALAVLKALTDANISDLKLKWVNDILLHGKKICGILTEAKSEGDITRVVVGIGINLKRPNGGFPAEIANCAAAIHYNGSKHMLATTIIHYLNIYTQMSSKEIAAAYGRTLAMVGEHITVTDYGAGGIVRHGTFLGVDEQCFLHIREENGTEHIISSGEITY